MTAIRDAANLWLRTYEADGIPASGLNEPNKAEGRAFGRAVDQAIEIVGTAAAAAGITVVKTTFDALDADKAHADGILAFVWNDPTPVSNGVYVKVGASGTGSWTKSALIFPSGLTDDLETIRDAAEGWRDDAEGFATDAGGSATASDASATAALASEIAARAAAEASGPQRIYDTKAAATADLASIPADSVILVLVDETHSSARTNYRKTSGVLVYKTDLGDALLRADIAADTGATRVGYKETGAASATTLAAKVAAGPSSAKGFTATGNGSTDEATKLDALFAQATSDYDHTTDGLANGLHPRVELDAAIGYKSTTARVVTGGAEVVMHGPLLISKAAGTAIVGLQLANDHANDLQSPRSTRSIVDVRRSALSSSGSETDIGVKVDSIYFGDLTVLRADSFHKGVEVCMGYGVLTLGDLRDNRIAVDITSRDGSSTDQFTNHIRVVGGGISVAGRPGQTRIGARVKPAATYGANTIVLDGQSFEMNVTDAGVADCLDYLLDGSVGPVGWLSARNQRSEYSGTPRVRAVGNVMHYSIGYIGGTAEYDYPEALFLDNEANYGQGKVFRQNGPNDGQIWEVIHDTGLLAEIVVQMTGSVITLKNAVGVRHVSTSPGSVALEYYTGPSFDGSGYMSNGGPQVGYAFDLNGDYSLAARGDKEGGGAFSMNMVLFDSAGAQIHAANAVATESNNTATLNTATYGGLYSIGIHPTGAADTWNAEFHFAKSLDVARVVFMPGSKTRRMQFLAMSSRPHLFMLNPQFKDQFIGDAIPVGLTGVTYMKGTIVWALNPAAGGFMGWVLTTQPAAGAAGTWVPFGPIKGSSAYTIANASADRALNVTADTVAQVAAVLGTLIADLQTAGVLA